jgi:predicted nuclease of predicted toxin-antitoxin system
MHFLADQDIYRITIDVLKEWGHDVVPIKEIGMARARDENLLSAARKVDRILITRDKDFGELLFLKEEMGDRGYLLAGGSEDIWRGSSRA